MTPPLPSPPITAPVSSMCSATLTSPTGVRSTSQPNSAATSSITVKITQKCDRFGQIELVIEDKIVGPKPPKHKAVGWMTGTGGESQRAAFDHRLVLENPDFGWPADMMEQARALRDAARTAQLRPCHATRRHGSQHVRILTPDMTARFFDNRDPRDWTDPVQICATEWVS